MPLVYGTNKQLEIFSLLSKKSKETRKLYLRSLNLRIWNFLKKWPKTVCKISKDLAINFRVDTWSINQLIAEALLYCPNSKASFQTVMNMFRNGLTSTHTDWRWIFCMMKTSCEFCCEIKSAYFASWYVL